MVFILKENYQLSNSAALDTKISVQTILNLKSKIEISPENACKSKSEKRFPHRRDCNYSQKLFHPRLYMSTIKKFFPKMSHPRNGRQFQEMFTLWIWKENRNPCRYNSSCNSVAHWPIHRIEEIPTQAEKQSFRKLQHYRTPKWVQLRSPPAFGELIPKRGHFRYQ